MASPLVGRPPTCLACLRRVTSVQASTATVTLQQVRGKKTEGRLKDQGVVVRLLKDVPQFGPEGSIFRTDRGRMRNHFFPNRKAEYMTTARFAELGLSKRDIGERDYTFGIHRNDPTLALDAVEVVAGGKAAAGEPVKAAVELDQLPPNRALELMQSLIDQSLIFERRLVHNPAPGEAAPSATSQAAEAAAAAAAAAAQATPTIEAQPEPKSEANSEAKKMLSPLEIRRAMLRGQTEEGKREAEQAAREATEAEERRAAAAAKVAAQEELERERLLKEAEEKLKIHGSVTLQNIANMLKEKMLLDAEASRISIQPEDIKFIGLADDVDRIEKIGSFEVEINAHVGKSRIEPIRRKIEIVSL